jgi:lantibiotic modifying enzyme
MEQQMILLFRRAWANLGALPQEQRYAAFLDHILTDHSASRLRALAIHSITTTCSRWVSSHNLLLSRLLADYHSISQCFLYGLSDKSILSIHPMQSDPHNLQ